MGDVLRPTKMGRALGSLAVVAAVALAALPAGARAGGRLIETGHDADWRCAVTGTQCHFIQVAVSYVRNGAPDPAKKLLVLDNGNLEMRQAIINAFGAGIVSQMDVVDPRTQFAAVPLSPAVYSAIVVASDQTCGKDGRNFTHGGDPMSPTSYCDLNRPSSGWPPPVIGSPGTLTDTNAIGLRSADIKSFFDAGGGVFVGSGADNGDGHKDDTYYSFIDVTGGAGGSACDTTGTGGLCLGDFGSLALTPEGRAIGFTDGTGGTADDITCGLNGSGCATHNSFQAPRVGSLLLVAESGPMNFESTLFADANPPDTVITSGPGTPLAVAAPAPPIAVTDSSTASVAFRASEDTTTFQCALDTGAATACSSPTSFSGLGPGVHKVKVTSTDAGHNQDQTPAELSWLVAFDRDHDGYLQSNPFGPVDCNDANRLIHPGAKEVRGNRVDENCDQVIAPFRRLHPAFAYRLVAGGCAHCLRLARLVVSNLSVTATVRIRCSGGGRRCHFTRTAGRAGHHKKRINLLRYVRGRNLRVGTLVEISVTKAKTIGSVKRLVVVLRKGKLDVRDRNLCRSPGSRRPSSHCATIR